MTKLMSKQNVRYTKLDETSDKSTSYDNNGNERLFIIYLRIFLIVSLYWIVSISMVFLNKQILSNSQYSIDAPLFICWFQCLVTLCLTVFLSILSMLFSHLAITDDLKIVHYKSGLKSNQIRFTFQWLKAFPPFELRRNVFKQIYLLTFVFVGMITCNNLCLKYVGVAFYFVGRSLTIVFNVFFTFIILKKRTSKSVIFCCLFIIIGFLLGSDQEKLMGSLSISGLFFGILASIFVSLNSIFTVNALKAVDGNIWLLTMYNNLLACIFFIPLMIIFDEFSVLLSNLALLSTSNFWFLMLLSGLFGFLINYVTSLQIKFTSPLTHNISGTAKSCAQTVLATYYYQEVKTFTWWLSNIIVLLATAAYTRIKQLEMSNKSQSKMDSSSQVDKETSNKIYRSKAENV